MFFSTHTDVTGDSITLSWPKLEEAKKAAMLNTMLQQNLTEKVDLAQNERMLCKERMKLKVWVWALRFVNKY